MYMGPIVAAKVARPAASPLARQLVGVPVLLLAAIVMLPWLGLNAIVGGVVLGARALVRLPATFVRMTDYAGQVALGR